MKKPLLTISLALAALAIFTVSSNAQIVVTYKGDTGLINQQPGSSSDFIDFWSGNYNDSASPGNPTSVNNVLNGTTTTSSLEAFSFAGGVTTQNNPGTPNFATVTTPLGQNFLTGTIAASSAGPVAGERSIAFAVTPGSSTTFNYNDFYIYLMYSNTNGVDNDLSISLAPRSSVQNGGDYSAGAPTTELVTDNLNVTLDGSSPSTADYLKFRVTGLETANMDGYSPDLVVSAIASTNPAYIGGVSFESISDVPEPSTWAMMLSGLVVLGLAIRRKSRV